MSNRRKQTPKMLDNWQVIVGQLKSLLAESSTGVLVVVIDQSTIIVDNSSTRNTTLIEQHGRGNTNLVGDCNNLRTVEEHN